MSAGWSEAAVADPVEASEDTDPAATCGGGGDGEWLCALRNRCGGTTLLAGGIVSRCRRAAS